MEETTFSISVLRHFVRRCVFFLVVIGGVGRFNFFKYGLSNIAFPDQFWMSFVGCREEVCPPNIYLGYYVLDNGDSYSRFSSNVD
jgi:hypothetical protein